jgi:hypothetical protein
MASASPHHTLGREHEPTIHLGERSNSGSLAISFALFALTEINDLLRCELASGSAGGV